MIKKVMKREFIIELFNFFYGVFFGRIWKFYYGDIKSKNIIFLSIKGSGVGIKNVDQITRLGFIRKVYGIFFVQLLITVLFIILSMNSKDFRKFQIYNTWLLYVSLVITLIVTIALTCFFQIARQVPLNYFLLFTFTFCEAYLVSYICILYDAKIVIMAAVMTAGVGFSLTL